MPSAASSGQGGGQGGGQGAAGASAELRSVRRHLSDAGDGQLLKVLAVVESLVDRGAADMLLAPLRGRLGVLRPARPMRFARFLFLPLDPLIVDAKGWRPDSPLIPRTALTPIAALVRDGLGEAAATLEATLGVLRGSGMSAIGRLGTEFWPGAARALAAAEMPPSWTAQGLPPAAFLPLRGTIAFLLAAEAGLQELRMSSAGSEVTELRLDALLLAARQRGAQCWGMLLALLLQRFPDAEAPVRAAVSAGPDHATTDSAEAALEIALRWVEVAAAARGRPAIAEAADEVGRQVALLDRLGKEATLRRRAAELRSALQVVCAARFEVALNDVVSAKLVAALDGTAVTAMEADARHLRRLETEARRLGGGAGYDSQLRAAAEQVRGTAHLEPCDRMRLMEILVGAPLALQACRTSRG